MIPNSEIYKTDPGFSGQSQSLHDRINSTINQLKKGALDSQPAIFDKIGLYEPNRINEPLVTLQDLLSNPNKLFDNPSLLKSKMSEVHRLLKTEKLVLFSEVESNIFHQIEPGKKSIHEAFSGNLRLAYQELGSTNIFMSQSRSKIPAPQPLLKTADSKPKSEIVKDSNPKQETQSPENSTPANVSIESPVQKTENHDIPTPSKPETRASETPVVLQFIKLDGTNANVTTVKYVDDTGFRAAASKYFLDLRSKSENKPTKKPKEAHSVGHKKSEASAKSDNEALFETSGKETLAKERIKEDIDLEDKLREARLKDKQARLD